MQKLLVIDDEPNILFTVTETLSSTQLSVVVASSGKEGIELFRSQLPDVVLLDVRLPDMSGLDVFAKIHAIDPRIPVIIMTAFSRTDTAIEAMSRGAFEYLLKPVDFMALRELVQRAVLISRLSQKPAVVDATEATLSPDADVIIGNAPAMQDIYKTIGRVAPQDVTVLVLGESGTGKELVARAIYHYSKRNKKPFLAINCAALPESLLESELFGHEKGAFTGADQRRIGKFEQVNGGTIFLDEIGDMSPSTQAKALRLLQQQQFERVGGSETIQTDVRIVAATNKDLAAMVAAGTFRQDLYYRLNGFAITLPPLRERKSDIRLLTDYFVNTLSREFDKRISTVTSEVYQLLEAHSWPGNVRELHSAIRYALVNATTEVITPDCLPPNIKATLTTAQQPPQTPHSPGGLEEIRQLTQHFIDAGSNDIYRSVIHDVERTLLEAVLQHTHGNQQLAAERLGISRMTLRAKLKQRTEDGE